MMTRERTMEDYGELYIDIYTGQNIHIKKALYVSRERRKYFFII